MKAVIGLGFGDEGKGLVTDYLCGESIAAGKRPVVVRFNGGHQAGHTVIYQGRRHVFSSFGSGTLRGCPTYWAKPCTFYPTAFLAERKLLEDLNPRLHIHEECPVVTPLDVAAGQRRARETGHGSVGVGFGATLQREEDHYHLFARDLFFPQVLAAKLQSIRRYYADYRTNLDQFIEDCFLAASHVFVDVYASWRRGSDDVIFEGAQGIMLDQRFGIFPNVTRSFTTGHVAREMGATEMYYVTRSYLTRHGNGWMPNEDFLGLSNNEHETNRPHPWQGMFRMGKLDTNLLRYALMCDDAYAPGRRDTLVVTCMDQLGARAQDPEKLRRELGLERLLVSRGPTAQDIAALP